jgi:hypothetical protein
MILFVLVFTDKQRDNEGNTCYYEDKATDNVGYIAASNSRGYKETSTFFDDAATTEMKNPSPILVTPGHVNNFPLSMSEFR